MKNWKAGSILRAVAAAGLLAGSPLVAGAAEEEAQTRPSRPEPEVLAVVDGDPVTRYLPQDAITPVDEPEMVSAAAADAFMKDDEMVLGVDDGSQARAYSTWHLDRHEVVNDQLGETPIAATW